MVAFEHSLKRLGGAPLRVRRDQRLDAVQGEGELDVERLLGPERPIVVEDGDPRRRRHVVGTVLIGHRLDEREDTPLQLTIILGRQRISLVCVSNDHVYLPRLESRS